MIFNNKFKRNLKLEKNIAEILKEHSLVISVAESCTGGLLSSRLTDISGSSEYIRANFVTYSNESKMALLDVKDETLRIYGAVSEQCAREMSEGLYRKTKADIAISTTGLAGPTGATETKPIGLMYVGITNRYKSVVQQFKLNPKFDRIRMKQEFTQCALQMLLDSLSEGYN